MAPCSNWSAKLGRQDEERVVREKKRASPRGGGGGGRTTITVDGATHRSNRDGELSREDEEGMMGGHRLPILHQLPILPQEVDEDIEGMRRELVHILDDHHSIGVTQQGACQQGLQLACLIRTYLLPVLPL